MSDVDQTQQAQPSPNQNHDDVVAQIKWQGKQIDWLLQWLVKFVANTKVEMGVTLTVGGNLVSGHLISPMIISSSWRRTFPPRSRSLKTVLITP